MPEDCVLPDFDEETGNEAMCLYAVLDRDPGYALERFNEASEQILRVLYVFLTHDPDRPRHVIQKETNAFWLGILQPMANRRGIFFEPCKCVSTNA